MLTRRQHELMAFLAEYMADSGGVSPSFDEMKVALKLKSKSGIHRLVTGLEMRGYIVRLPNYARSIKILRSPDGSSADAINALKDAIRRLLAEQGPMLTFQCLVDLARDVAPQMRQIEGAA